MNSLSPLVLPNQPPIPSEPILGSPYGPAAERAAQSAIVKRAHQPLLPLMFSVQALLPHLPLSFPSHPDCPPSPKLRYRSMYRYLGPEALLEEAKLDTMTDFQISLHLIDFSPNRDELAQIYQPSHKGQVPFDPVSMELSICLRREKKLSWSALSTLLKGEEGAAWRRLFGFTDTDTPSASGLRYFFQKVGHEFFDDLCPRMVEMLGRQHLLPEQSTFPGDPPDRGVTVTQDGMLHEALGRPSCQLATDECYQPVAKEQPLPKGKAPGGDERDIPPPVDERDGTSAGRAGCLLPSPDEASEEAQVASAPCQTEGEPKPTEGRPCRARGKALEGCSCDTEACKESCRRASNLDPEARFIHYQGNKAKHGDAKGGLTKGKDVFGYRSVADRILDDRFSVAWTARSHLYPANTDERTIFKEGLLGFKTRLPQVKIGEWLDDSGVGYGECLDAVWEIGALRMVDLRADKGDQDFEVCLGRGYDGKGRPLCIHGYPMSSNGYDSDRRRAKYVCNQLCTREPLHEKEPVSPVEGCPYLGESRPLGQVRNLGRAFPDGSVRLAREIPYGSEAWKSRYGRRNLSESRNGQMEGLGLKRMASYGLPRNQKEVQVADFLLNLRTLGRLVREATGILQG